MLWKQNGRFSLVTGRDWSPLCLKHWSGDISSLLASCSAFVGDFSARYLPLQQLKLIENYILHYGNWYIILIVKYGVAKNVNTQVEVQTPQSKCTFQTHVLQMSHFKGTVRPFLPEILKLRDERVNGVPRPPRGCRAVMVGYMWSESACITTPRKRDGRSFSVWSTLRFTHPAAAAAGEQRRLLTRRRRLQILSMLRIRSLCGHKDNVWLTVHSFSSLRIWLLNTYIP